MPFTYQPMTANSIRILHLQPGLGDEPIHCTVSEHQIEKAPPYQAISYCWGDSLNLETIRIGGQEFSVRRNLASLLQHIRCQSSEIQYNYRYWIDALCIDQGNIPERNRQVEKIRTIYRNARSVLVWLGDTAEDSGVAMKFMEEVGNGEYTSTCSQRQWQAMSNLFGRAYWSRTWVIQEIALAQSLSIMCGQQRISWKVFEAFMSQIRDPLGNVLLVYPEHKERHPWTLVQQRRNGLTSTLPELVERYSDCQVTDVRDRVYAMLGLVSPTDELALRYFPVNYSSSKAQIFWDTICQCGLEDLAAVERFAKVLLQTLNLSVRESRAVFETQAASSNDDDDDDWSLQDSKFWQSSAYAIATAVATLSSANGLRQRPQAPAAEEEQAFNLTYISRYLEGNRREVVTALIDLLQSRLPPKRGLYTGRPIRIWTYEALQCVSVSRSEFVAPYFRPVTNPRTGVLQPPPPPLLTLSLISESKSEGEGEGEGTTDSPGLPASALSLAGVDMSPSSSAAAGAAASTSVSSEPCSKMRVGDILVSWWPKCADLLMRRAGPNAVLVGRACYDTSDSKRKKKKKEEKEEEEEEEEAHEIGMGMGGAESEPQRGDLEACAMIYLKPQTLLKLRRRRFFSAPPRDRISDYGDEMERMGMAV